VRDFKQRIVNEHGNLWNDVRKGKAVEVLKQKWNYPDYNVSPGVDDEG
jgi:hypothetical protein